MPITHHPDDNYLAEYSAGACDWAVSLLVSCHLQYCHKCKARITELNALGGQLLHEAPKVALNDDALARALTRIEAQGTTNSHLLEADYIDIDGDLSRAPPVPANAVKPEPLLEELPKAVRSNLSQLSGYRWRSLNKHHKIARLALGQDQYEVALHNIKQGGKVFEHGHKGLELTLVLKGSFSDEDGIYKAGDFLVREPGQVHCPTATQNEDCLCLAASTAPVALAGPLGKLINPFLRIHPS